MARGTGQRFPKEVRAQAIGTVMDLLAAGIPDGEVRQQIGERYDVSDRTARNWLNAAYRKLRRQLERDHAKLVSIALQRRRLVMSRAARAGHWGVYLSAAESEAKLLGLNAPERIEVLQQQAQHLVRDVAELIAEFLPDLATKRQFFECLCARVNQRLQTKQPPIAPIPLNLPPRDSISAPPQLPPIDFDRD